MYLVEVGQMMRQNQYFTSIQLPDTVTSIGENAFAYNHLQNINIPNSVMTIGKEAFAGNDFSTIEVSENVNTINDGAFKDCKKLQKDKASRCNSKFRFNFIWQLH